MSLPGSQQDLATPLVHVKDLRKNYSIGNADVELFRGLHLSVPRGELVSIVGESGSGKSTLLHLLAAMDTPTSGEVSIAGFNLAHMTPRQQANFRNSTIGYVWQFHYLLPEFTAEENVAMPLLARGVSRSAALDRARQWLAEVGLAHRTHHRSGELSGGEQQRVSLARALVTGPQLLLADEPTGNLDSRTAEAVFALLQHLHRTHALTSVIVTHHLALAQRCHRTLLLHEGLLTVLQPDTTSVPLPANVHETVA